MPKILNINSYSLNVKVAISLFLLALFLITILFALIVPKIQKDEYKRTIKEIEQVLSITQEQVKTAGKAISIQAKLEKELTRNQLELELFNIEEKSKKENLSNIRTLIEKSKIINHCFYAIKENQNTIINNNADIYNLHKIKQLNTWEILSTEKLTRSYVHKIKYFFYTKNFSHLNSQVSIFCKESNLNKNHSSFEKTVKINVQNAFNTTQDLHKGKTYLLWINSKYINEDDKPLYIADETKISEKYTISNMSNVSNIFTGNLTAKQINEAKDKEPIHHLLNNKKAISWIKNLSDKKDGKYTFLLIKTLYKSDIRKEADSVFFKVLPAALFSLLLALAIGFFLFKRLFKSINTLTTTAKLVNNGNKTIRSKVKGNDDIGNLGLAFDSMLDSFESSIKTLDSKVSEKTKELSNSLEEKEILLKEIHHRVKNNLALTISLIKLQQAKIKDDKTKKILKDIQERIYTMELLHRKLYESTNLNSIAFKEYVTNLTNDISRTYNYENSVDINIDMEDIYLNIETAMPCGLILNELITNSFKYAFSNNDNPKLNIQMYKIKDQYSLILKDNGEGIKDDIDIHRSNSLGLKLINSISKLQLNGDLEYYYDKGAVFKIKF